MSEAEMVAAVEDLVAWVARAVTPDPGLREDLRQAGRLGALIAARRYDPARGASWHTYALWRIRREMLRELSRQLDRVHVAVHAVEAGMSRPAVGPLDDLAPAPSADPLQALAARDDVERLLARLPPATAWALEARYGLQDGEEWSFDAVAAALGASRGAVRERCYTALRRLRASARPCR